MPRTSCNPGSVNTCRRREDEQQQQQQQLQSMMDGAYVGGLSSPCNTQSPRVRHHVLHLIHKRKNTTAILPT